MRMLIISALLLVLALGLLYLVWFFVLGKSAMHGEEPLLKIGQAQYKVEIADTAYLQSKGLSGRGSLAEDKGMLFVFKPAKKVSFWMKGMQFPLDIIWIRDKEVIGIEKNVPLNEKAFGFKQYSPAEAVDWVLELNAGQVSEKGIKIGDRAELK